MQDLARIEARLESLNELQDLFSAMQAMAASRIEGALSALAGIRTYEKVLEEAIGDAVSLHDPKAAATHLQSEPQRSALLVVTSEHGFAGAFNRRLLEKVREERAPGDEVMIIGQRGAAIAGEQDIAPNETLPMATHVEGVLPVARRIATRLQDIDSVRVVFGHYQGASQFDVSLRKILPPDPKIVTPPQNGAPPLHQLAPHVLLRALLNELLVAGLTLALMESFASENAARLQVMQSATHNIGEKRDNLGRQAQRRRQQAITTELLEIVAGGEAVNEAGAGA